MTDAEAIKLIVEKYDNDLELFYREVHIPEIERRLSAERAIGAAILKERKECAEIAKGVREWLKGAVAQETSHQIETRIRARGK